MTIDFRDRFFSFGKKYRMASMFIITRAVGTLRDVERRESGSMFRETIEIISWSSYESTRKHENIALKSTMTEQWIQSFSSRTNSIISASLFAPLIWDHSRFPVIQTKNSRSRTTTIPRFATLRHTRLDYAIEPRCSPLFNSQTFNGFSHDNSVKMKLPRQT